MISILAPVLAVWAYASVQLYALAVRRGRRGVRSSALRARAALIVGVLLTLPAVAVDPWLAPLLLLPAGAAVLLTLPRLGALIRPLYADPWGPSDPAVRRATLDPALTVPAPAGLLGALVAGLAPTGAAAALWYGIVAVAAAGLTLAARSRRTRLERQRIGRLPRMLVRAPRARYDIPELPERHPVAA
jgi:hypothetical protein